MLLVKSLFYRNVASCNLTDFHIDGHIGRVRGLGVSLPTGPSASPAAPRAPPASAYSPLPFVGALLRTPPASVPALSLAEAAACASSLLRLVMW